MSNELKAPYRFMSVEMMFNQIDAGLREVDKVYTFKSIKCGETLRAELDAHAKRFFDNAADAVDPLIVKLGLLDQMDETTREQWKKLELHITFMRTATQMREALKPNAERVSRLTAKLAEAAPILGGRT